MLPSSFQRLSRLLGLLVFAISSASSASADVTWREIRSPHFRVLTDGSERDGRNVAQEFEEMHHAFVVLFQRERVEAGAPLTIIAARDEGTFRDLEPITDKVTDGRVAGLFRRGWEKQFALIRLDTWGDENQVVVYHEYAHSILHANTHWLPTWMDEGLAEFYGYTRFEKNRILIGTPSRRIAILRFRPLIPMATLLTSSNPITSHDDVKMQMFYAESWAVVHFMQFGNGPDGSKKITDFLRALQEQVPEQKAFRDTFGDPSAFDKRLAQYVQQFAFQAGVLPPEQGVDPKEFVARQLSPAEVAFELGSYRIGAHEFAAGRASIEKAVALDPKLAVAHEELGYLDFVAGKDELAHQEWTEALSLNSSLTRSQFALLMTAKPLAEQTPEQLGETKTTLQRLTAADPRFAPPFVELALTEWRLGQMNPAYKDARMAETLEPWRSGYRLLSGHILAQGNQPKLAAQYSRYIAGHWAASDHNEAVDLWTQLPPDKRDDGPALALDVPEGTQVVRGTLLDATCGVAPDATYRIKLQPDTPAGAPPLTLSSDKGVRVGFTDTLWYGEDHFTRCHHIAGLPALIAYRPGAGGGGTLVSLEIRDSFPDNQRKPSPAGAEAAAAAPAAAPAP